MIVTKHVYHTAMTLGSLATALFNPAGIASLPFWIGVSKTMYFLQGYALLIKGGSLCPHDKVQPSVCVWESACVQVLVVSQIKGPLC